MEHERVTERSMTGADEQKDALTPQPARHTVVPAHPLLRVQRTIGNQAVQRLIQAKLTINQPGDVYEQEADRMAERVTASPALSAVQRKCACGGTAGPDGECTQCRMKRLTLQRRPTSQAEPDTVPPIVHDALRSPGQPLDTATRDFMESRFGRDFGEVRIHTDAEAAESARAVNALAYTVGRNVVFGAGQHSPKSAVGRRLLAHELTHVVQQGSADHRGAGSTPMLQRQADAPIPWGTLPLGRSQVYEVKPGDYLRKIAEMFYGDAMQWPRIYAENKDVIGPDPDKIFAGQTLVIPVGGGTGTGCRPVITYSRPRVIRFGPPGTCGAAIQYDITNVAASGKGCPPSLAGLAVTETVTSDHGCGSTGPVKTGSFRIGPGGAIPPGATDTYGFYAPKSKVPPCEIPCTENYAQSLFVGGMYADSHVITFTMCASASSCSTVVERDGVLVGILS
jgi:hypothetical protein